MRSRWQRLQREPHWLVAQRGGIRAAIHQLLPLTPCKIFEMQKTHKKTMLRHGNASLTVPVRSAGVNTIDRRKDAVDLQQVQLNNAFIVYLWSTMFDLKTETARSFREE